MGWKGTIVIFVIGIMIVCACTLLVNEISSMRSEISLLESEIQWLRCSLDRMDTLRSRLHSLERNMGRVNIYESIISSIAYHSKNIIGLSANYSLGGSIMVVVCNRANVSIGEIVIVVLQYDADEVLIRDDWFNIDHLEPDEKYAITLGANDKIGWYEVIAYCTKPEIGVAWLFRYIPHKEA